MTYTDTFDATFSRDPLLGLICPLYASVKTNPGWVQWQQAVVALYNAAAAVLADGSSTAPQLAAAGMVIQSPLTFGQALYPAFCADPTVQANYAAPSDAQMQAAANWILPILWS